MTPKEMRLAALQKWVGRHGVPPKEKSYFSQVLTGKAPFGERAAERLARDYKINFDDYAPDLPVSMPMPDPETLVSHRQAPYHVTRSPATDAPAWGKEVKLEGNEEYPAVRRVRFKLSAGANGFAVDYLEDDDAPIVFRSEWFKSRGFTPSKLFAVRVANGSMQPGLWHGDTVVVNTAETEPRDGEAFAVNFEGELVIKRLVHDEGRWWLRSDNPDQSRYPRKVCDERVFIIGRIVHKQSEHV